LIVEISKNLNSALPNSILCTLGKDIQSPTFTVKTNDPFASGFAKEESFYLLMRKELNGKHRVEISSTFFQATF